MIENDEVVQLMKNCRARSLRPPSGAHARVIIEALASNRSITKLDVSALQVRPFHNCL